MHQLITVALVYSWLEQLNQDAQIAALTAELRRLEDCTFDSRTSPTRHAQPAARAAVHCSGTRRVTR